MNRFFNLVALVSALALGACDGPTAPDLLADGVHEASDAQTAPAHMLEVGEVVRLSGRAALLFEEVLSDNRCPVGVQCPWAGEARTRFTLAIADGTTYDVRLTLPGGFTSALPLGDAPRALAGGYVIRLLQLQPYPGDRDYPGNRDNAVMPVTATIHVEPCPTRCVEIYPPPADR